jgi:hypothetical protein
MSAFGRNARKFLISSIDAGAIASARGTVAFGKTDSVIRNAEQSFVALPWTVHHSRGRDSL